MVEIMTGIAGLLGLALLDALNPFSIAAMAFLLSTDRPSTRGLAFILGTAVVYLGFGIMLLEGWTAFLQSLLPLLPSWIPALVEVLAGAGCLVGGIILWRKSGSDTQSMPQISALSVWATVLFAAGSTVSDLPTAVPYFAAASQITSIAEGRLGQYFWLLIYNVIYVAPMVAMLVVRLTLRKRADGVFSAIRKGVDWAFKHLMPLLLILFGIFLLFDGVRRLAK